MATEDDPLRVLVAGDSVTGELRLPIEAALESGGHGSVEFVVQPTIPREPGHLEAWARALEESAPELVVIMLGYWERRDLEAWTVGALPPAEPYRRDEVEPFVRSATEAGARVLWLAGLPTADPDASTVYAELNHRYAEVAAAEPATDYLDVTHTVTGVDGGYRRDLPTEAGPQQVRWDDGLHLCPDGSALMARPVLDWITGTWGIPLGDGWEHGGWRSSMFSGAEACPPR